MMTGDRQSSDRQMTRQTDRQTDRQTLQTEIRQTFGGQTDQRETDRDRQTDD